MDSITLAPKADAPVILEKEEPVDLQGVRLFLHSYSGQASKAPMLSSRFTIEPGCGTQEDKHAVNELWFVSEGDLDVFHDGKWHTIKNGQTLYFAPWQRHYARNNGTRQVQVFSVWWA